MLDEYDHSIGIKDPEPLTDSERLRRMICGPDLNGHFMKTNILKWTDSPRIVIPRSGKVARVLLL